MNGHDLLVIAGFAALGAGAAGVIGWTAVPLLRRRSLAVSIFSISVVTVLAMVAGTATVAWKMFISKDDFVVVLTVLGIGGVVSLLVSALLGRQVVRSSRALRRAARTVGSDAGFAPPKEPLGAELAALSQELAATSARLAESRERERALEHSRRELIAWISHDLRTPLAGMRAMAEALEDGVADEPYRYFQRMRAEVDRLTGMVDDLFELSKIQAGALTLSLERVSVYDLVGDAIAGAYPLARERGVRLVGGEIEPAPIEVDGREITRVLANLLINAIRSTPADGTVAVATRREPREIVVSVTDSCGGIPESDLSRVFDTGWRGASARTPRAARGGTAVEHHGDTGAGLGLAIVRGIVEAHAGRASVHNVHGGCCFEIALPLAA